MLEMDKVDIAPFYSGQKVIGSDKVLPTSRIKKGHPYRIRICYSSINPANGLGPFWYVGVEEWPEHNWLGPHLFSPIEECKLPLMSFSKIVEVEKEELLLNN